MKDGRMAQGGAQTHTMKCTFKHESDSTVSAKFKAGMEGIGLNVGGSKEQHTSVHFELNVTFWTGGKEDEDQSTAAAAGAAGTRRGSVELRTLLTQLDLMQYLPKLKQLGYDKVADVEQLQEEKLTKDIAMAPGHAARLRGHFTSNTGK